MAPPKINVRDIRKVKFPKNKPYVIVSPKGSGRPQAVALDDLTFVNALKQAGVGAGSGLTSIADGYVLANISGGSAKPIGNALSSVLDHVFGNAQGDVLYRNASGWVVLAPGTSGNFLQTQGAGANPAWASAAANIQTLLDGIGNTRGAVLYRGASGWAILAPGTSGNFLKSNGAGADPSYAAGNSGTVTSVGLSLPAEFTVSGSPVTAAGTLTGVWADQTQNKVFASPNGSTGTPAFRALVSGDLPAGTTPVGANPTATASDVAVNGSAATFLRSDGAPAIQKTSAAQFGVAKVDGSSITASGGVISAAGFVPLAAAFHPGFVTGRYYTRPMIQGGLSTLTLTANTLYAIPFFVPATFTLTKMAVRLSNVAAGKSLELGIYTNSAGVPSSKEFDAGSVSAGSLGDAIISSLSHSLSIGWYWLVVASDGTPQLVSYQSSYGDTWFFGAVSNLNVAVDGITAPWTFSANSLPGSFPAITYVNAVHPVILVAP